MIPIDHAAVQLMQALTNASIKSVIVLLIAWVATSALRRASGAVRHLVWTLATAAILVAPLLQLELPTWRVAVIPAAKPAPTPQSPVQFASQDKIGKIPPQNEFVDTDRPLAQQFDRASYTPPPAAAHAPVVPPVQPKPPHPVAFWLMLTWISAAIAIGVFGAVGAWMVLRIGRRASQAGEGPLRAMFKELRTQPPIRRPVKLLIGDPAAMPITWGILRPRILLPADAPHWPPDRARSVLLHELGHVRRWDCATQLLVLVACAIYWFNPLVWLTARRMRIERERACDDIVIGRGHSPADYAEYLVRLARDLHTRRMQSVVAVAMARKSGLADRVRAILNANIDRRDLNRRVVAISLAVVLAVLLPLSALRIMRKSGVARAADSTQPITTKPSSGEKLPLLPDRFSAKRVAVRVLSPAGEPIRIDSIQNIFVWIPAGPWEDGPTPQVLDRFTDGWIFVDKQMLTLARPGQLVDLYFSTGGLAMKVSAKFPAGSPKEITFDALGDLKDISVDTSTGPTAAPGEIAGQIVGPDGKPIAGAEIAFPDAQFRRNDAPTASGADGVFRMPGVGDRWFLYLRVSKPGYATRFLTDVPVGRGFVIHMDNRTHLKGQLLGSDGQPAANAAIQLVTSKAAERQRIGDFGVTDLNVSAQADTQGNYDVLLEPGDYEMRVTAPNGNGHYEHVEVPSGQTIGFSQKLGAGVTLKIVAIDTLTNKAVSGLHFHMIDQLGPGYSGWKQGSERATDANGVARWDKLMPGNVEVDVQSDTYARWWTDQTDGRDRAIDQLDINVYSGMSLVTVHVEPGVTATGTVFSPDGKPVAGADVNVVGLITGDSRYARPTNAQGQFSLTFPRLKSAFGMNPGVIDEASPPKFAIVAHDRQNRWANAAGDWFIPELGKTYPMTLKMSAGAHLRGRFVASNGTTLANLRVRAVAQDGFDGLYNAMALTDVNGRFELGPTRPGHYSIYFAADEDQLDRYRITGVPSLTIQVADGDRLEIGDVKYDGPAPKQPDQWVIRNYRQNTAVPQTDDASWRQVTAVLVPAVIQPAVTPVPVSQAQRQESQVLTLEEPLTGNPAPPGSLSGKVVDEAGKPLAGVVITVWARDHGDRTDTAGHFAFASLPKDRAVEIRWAKDGYCPRFIPAQPAGLSGLIVVLTNKTYFEGQVKDSSGKPVAGAKIRGDQGRKQLDRMFAPSVWTETTADQNGNYRLYVQPDTYDIQVRVPGAGVVRTGKVPIADGQAKNLDLNLSSGITFRARVIDSISKQPVPGVRLWSIQNPGVEGTSDPSGNLVIPFMVPGVISLDVDAKGYARWWSDLADKEWERQLDTRNDQLPWNWNDLEYDMSQDMSVATIVVEPEVKISGIVVDPDGNPVSGASVCIADTGTNRAIAGNEKYSVITKSIGTFDMTLPASEAHGYNLFAHDGAHGKWRKYANGVLPIIYTTPGQKLTDIKLTLTRAAIVRGRVLDADGNPVANRQVRAVPSDLLEDMNNEPTARTDRNGDFELEYVRPCSQIIQVAPFIYRDVQNAPPGTSATVNLAAGQTLDGVNLTAMPGDEE